MRCIIVAHRGACAYAPENTRAAIRKALALKADMIELDVQLTQDNRLVIFHDARLDRTTNGHGVLSRWPYRELVRLDCGSWFSPRFSGERILLASQALRLIPPPSLINLELKRTSRRDLVVKQLVRCLRWTRTTKRVVVSSLDPSLLARLKARQPQVSRALLCRRNPHQALRNAIALGCAALHPHKSLLSPSLIKRAHAAGLRVHVWTVNHAHEARRLLRLGVDGMVTNVPDRIRRIVRWSPSARGVT